VERRVFVRVGVGVGVNEVESWAFLMLELGEVDPGRMALVLEVAPRVLEVDTPFARLDAERVTRGLFLLAEGFGDVF
jgi:hypothetical protein